MKKFLLSIIGIVVFSFFIGLLLFKIAVYDENENLAKNKENQNEQENITNIAIVRTSIEEEKVSPNASLILKKYYSECDHIEKEIVEIPKEMVNLRRDEIQEKYSDWEIVSFSSKELVIAKKFNGNCNNHYVIREKNGKIVVYKVSNNNESVFKNTDISTEYLTNQDRQELNNGIQVIRIR